MRTDVKLTRKQVALLNEARTQTDTSYGFWAEGDVDTALCACMAVNGLLAEPLPYVFTITPEGRAWLAANKQGGERE